MQPGRSISSHSSALEYLPHLTRQICGLWGKDELEGHLNSLIMDARDGRRQGLPLETVDELLFLLELIIAKRALHASETAGVPFRQAFRQHLEKSRKFTAFKPDETADPWSILNDRREMGRAGDRSHGAMPAPAPAASAKHGRTHRKKTWWRRLVG